MRVHVVLVRTLESVLHFDIGIGVTPPIEMYCGNHPTIFNASNQNYPQAHQPYTG